jgi:hypothetical protein
MALRIVVAEDGLLMREGIVRLRTLGASVVPRLVGDTSPGWHIAVIEQASGNAATHS